MALHTVVIELSVPDAKQLLALLRTVGEDFPDVVTALRDVLEEEGND